MKKSYLIIIGIIIVAILLGGGGKYGYDFHNSEVERLQNDIKESQQKQDSLNSILEYSEQNNTDLIYKEDAFKQRYYAERKKRIQAEKERDNISSLIFSYKYLDSISAIVEYPKN